MISRPILLSLAVAAFGPLAALGCSGSPASVDPSDAQGPGTSGGNGAGSGGSGAGGSTVKSTTERDLAPQTTPANEASLVAGNSDFAFALYHGLAANDSASNLFYSPYSVSLALAMTYAGAMGETASQMAAALHFTLPEAALNPAFDKLDLAIEAKPANAVGQDGTPFAISLADSLWGDEHGSFDQTFVNVLAADYGAGLRTVDFVDDPASAEAAINAWVSTETDGKISPLLAPGAVSSETALVLVNTVYFNAAWAAPFEKAATMTGTFTRADGSTVETPLMSSQQTPARYAKGDDYQAIELPYSGGTTSMVIVLPDSGAYSAVESALSGAFFASVTAALSATSVSLRMPSFKIHGGSVSLVPELKAFGMVDAFGGNADFTAMVPNGGVYISDVIHQAFVDVDESGTEAAAATAVVVNINGVLEGQQVDVDHAFFFAIRDVATGTVLFVGRENDPTIQ